MPLPRCAPNRTRTRAANCAACRSARSTHFAALLLLTAAWPAGPALAAEYRERQFEPVDVEYDELPVMTSTFPSPRR